MPTFSIIIPVYNVAPYLRECLDSVLAQTFGDWEAICVDDGSTDGSGAILDEYAAKDPRFRVIHQPNSGVSVARNAALDVARGEWIGFLDGDDVWSLNWLEKIKVATSNGADWVRTGCTNWSKNGHVTSNAPVGQELWPDDHIGCGWWLISRCSFPFINYYKRVSISNVRFPVGVRYREDAIFGYEMVLRTNKLAFALTSGYARRERDGSATFSRRLRNDTINLLTEYVKLWTSNIAMLVGARVLEASTFWILKDVGEWMYLCEDKTYSDCLKVAKLMRRLCRLRAFSRQVPGTMFDNLRWRIFMATGLERILRINRLNLLGNKKSSSASNNEALSVK